jgi:ATP-dependent helicase/nuclease subunit A
VNRLDRNGLYRYDTLQYKGTKIQNTFDDISEEIRVLYVAMTRAKEKLIFVVSDLSKPINLFDLYDMYSPDGSIYPYDIISTGNFAKWIMAVALSASGCKALRDLSGIVFPPKFTSDADFITYKQFLPDYGQSLSKAEYHENDAIKADAEFIKQLEARMNYKYAYLPLTKIAAKRTASGFNEKEINDVFFAKEKPAFMGRESFTPAQKGTLTHLFMEKCDFEKAKKSVSDELDRLTENGIFTVEQAKAVNSRAIEGFFESDLFERMRDAAALNREQQFTVNIPASFFEDVETDETVVVQGKIDCFFIEDGEAVIVDYKTDYVTTEEELGDRYLTQMQIYKNAVEQFTGKKVKEVLLYSFALNGTVKCL